MFYGPSCVFTNVIANPRAHINRANELKKTIVENNVTIGATPTIICRRHQEYCMIGAGAVVTKNVKSHR